MSTKQTRVSILEKREGAGYVYVVKLDGPQKAIDKLLCDPKVDQLLNDAFEEDGDAFDAIRYVFPGVARVEVISAKNRK